MSLGQFGDVGLVGIELALTIDQDFGRMGIQQGQLDPAVSQDLYDEQARLLENILELGILRGEIRPCKVRTTARLIYDLTRSAIAQHVLEGDRNQLAESTNLICDLIWRGIGC